MKKLTAGHKSFTWDEETQLPLMLLSLQAGYTGAQNPAVLFNDFANTVVALWELVFLKICAGAFWDCHCKDGHF